MTQGMLGRTLQWLGVVAVLGLLGVSVAALSLVKDRLHIVVQDASAAEAPDPLALVRDDLQQLHADLEALAQALAKNLEVVAGRLEELGSSQTAERGELAAVRAEVQRLRGDELHRALVALRDRIAQLELRAQQAATEPVAAAEPKPTVPEAEPASRPAEEVPEEPAPVVAVPAEPVPEKPARRSGFLAFDLPSQGFRFDCRQRFRILPSLSRVGFDAKSTLRDFSGVTSKVDGHFVANLAAVESPWNGAIECDPATLRTGVDGRDEGLREHLLTGEHPTIRFEILGFTQATVDPSKQTATGTVRGRMSIRGKTREFAMPVTVSVDPSKRIVIDGQAPLKLTDYGVPVPSKVGVISMEDEVKVWVALRVRSTGEVDGDR